ncbi:MAG: hypothetical protein ACI9VR_004578 [Cognaticolwellia sp.]
MSGPAETQDSSGRLSWAAPAQWATSATAMAGGFALVQLSANFAGWSPALTELPVALGLGLGAAFASFRKWRFAPLLLAAPIAGVLAESWLGSHTLLLPGALLGLATAFANLRPRFRKLDAANGVLAGMGGSALASLLLLRGLGLPPAAEAIVAGLGATLLLLPALVRWVPRAHVPSDREVERRLSEHYRPPVLRAGQLFRQLESDADADTLDGLAEVGGWVFNLARSLQTIGRQLENVDHSDLNDRIELLAMEIEETEDPFTRDRRLATAKHLEQLLRHADQLRLERDRIASLQEYAVAYLEEARVGLTLASTLPGEHTPGRLHEVLDRLRQHTVEGDARRQSAREVHALG